MVGTALSVLAVALVIIVVMVLALLIRSSRDDRESDGENGATGFLDDDTGSNCGICFGELSENVKKCTCGRLFHDACAEPTGSCPYCGSGYEEFRDADDERMRCSNCGRYTTGRECRCGALLMKDGVFVCSCGSVIGVGETVCAECGREYETGGAV